MSEVKWIKITTNMFDDEKIKLIEAMPDRDAILIIWVKVLVQAGKCNATGYLFFNKNIPYTDEMLSTIFNRPISTIRMALEIFKRFGMIEIEDSTFCISNWEKHQNIEGMDKIKEQTRKRVEKHREKKKLLKTSNVTGNVTVTKGNAIDIEIDIDNNMSDFFEKVWSMYRRKEGKGKISESKKKKLFKLGDELIRAIERYNSKIDRENIESRFIQMGSTFFSSGYIDYLDKNYSTTDIPEQSMYREE